VTTVYFIVGFTCLHLVLAFVNAIGIKRAFFKKQSSMTLCLIVNWLVPVVGPTITYFVVRSSFSNTSAGLPVSDQSGSNGLYTGAEGRSDD
jgi:hypothetical protein